MNWSPLSRTSSEILTSNSVLSKKSTDGLPLSITSSIRKLMSDSEMPKSDSELPLLISKTPSTQRELDSKALLPTTKDSSPGPSKPWRSLPTKETTPREFMNKTASSPTTPSRPLTSVWDSSKVSKTVELHSSKFKKPREPSRSWSLN